MTSRKMLTTGVYEIAIRRLIELYETGGRVICTFSGGKDSGVCLELCRIAAKATGRSPVEVFMLDDEIMFPGTFEYAETVAAYPDVDFIWAIAREPMVCVWNRRQPYWWVFDNRLTPDEWVREPPAYAKYIEDMDLYNMVNAGNFPPPPGKALYTVIGNRADESLSRKFSIFSSSSFITDETSFGSHKVFPIYDWNVGDVWKAISDNKWPYNHAYDAMFKMGINAQRQRIAPPTMTFFGMPLLKMAANAWPRWFDKVEKRVPGARAIANFGIAAVLPIRKESETWEECYYRECIADAPAWIAERATAAKNFMLKAHAVHSDYPFPQANNCPQCSSTMCGGWKSLTQLMYTGDPYSLKATMLPYIPPSKFRPDDTRSWKANPSDR